MLTTCEQIRLPVDFHWFSWMVLCCTNGKILAFSVRDAMLHMSNDTQEEHHGPSRLSTIGLFMIMLGSLAIIGSVLALAVVMIRRQSKTRTKQPTLASMPLIVTETELAGVALQTPRTGPLKDPPLGHSMQQQQLSSAQKRAWIVQVGEDLIKQSSDVVNGSSHRRQFWIPDPSSPGVNVWDGLSATPEDYLRNIIYAGYMRTGSKPTARYPRPIARIDNWTAKKQRLGAAEALQAIHSNDTLLDYVVQMVPIGSEADIPEQELGRIFDELHALLDKYRVRRLV